MKKWDEGTFLIALLDRLDGWVKYQESFKSVVWQACFIAFGDEPQKAVPTARQPRFAGKAANLVNDLFVDEGLRTIGNCDYPREHYCAGGRHDLDEIVNDCDPRLIMKALGGDPLEGKSPCFDRRKIAVGDRLSHWWFPLVGTVREVLPDCYFGEHVVVIKFDGVRNLRTMLAMELADRKTAGKVRGHRS